MAFREDADSALGEIDLHDTATEKVDTQNSVDRPLTTAAKRAEIDRQDRFWKSDAAGYRLQIGHAISKTLPIDALHCLSISEMQSKTAGCLEIDSANAGA